MSNSSKHQLMLPYLPDAISGLMFLALDYNKDTEILGLAIDSLNFVLQVC